ncbi:MAG: MarR family winged helix-turn-helix transcriptional regulator [Thermoleophilaceae bacterium]
MSTLSTVIQLPSVDPTGAHTEASSERCSFLLGRVGKLMSRRFAKALAGTGLKPPHAGVLFVLRDGPRTQQALGELLHMDPSNLVGVLNEVEENGWAVRRRDPADRRRHIVEISKQGTELIARTDGVVAELESQILAVLDERERDQLRDLLSRIVEAAGAEDGLEADAA